ncbi:turripeptide OL11-like [Nilaparvata lugens]|uniref:turripeptide OL11-like n=1 Tax=Nilaparvata lugens TaxID=108931 RepID=UPI00193DB5AE|nr:turripeptide OL11-like [Nilaparvata lugens]
MYFCRFICIFALLLVCGFAAEIPTSKKSECKSFCTLEYLPICATDGHTMRTFPNACTLAIEECKHPGKWRKVKNGAC